MTMARTVKKQKAVESKKKKQPVAAPDIEAVMEEIKKIQDEQQQRLKELEQLYEKLSTSGEKSPAELREELVSGIHLLGERVNKAIQEINVRFDKVTQEIWAKIDQLNFSDPNGENSKDQQKFGPLKESDIFDLHDFEMVPRDAVKKLIELFKKQSKAVKHFMENQELRLQGVEKKIKTYEEENTRLLELLNMRVNRNFRLTLVATIFALILIVIVFLT